MQNVIVIIFYILSQSNALENTFELRWGASAYELRRLVDDWSKQVYNQLWCSSFPQGWIVTHVCDILVWVGVIRKYSAIPRTGHVTKNGKASMSLCEGSRKELSSWFSWYGTPKQGHGLFACMSNIRNRRVNYAGCSAVGLCGWLHYWKVVYVWYVGVLWTPHFDYLNVLKCSLGRQIHMDRLLSGLLMQHS